MNNKQKGTFQIKRTRQINSICVNIYVKKTQKSTHRKILINQSKIDNSLISESQYEGVGTAKMYLFFLQGK